MVSLPIEKIYEDTVKFSCNNEHNEQDIFDMLAYRGYKNAIWGINLTNRGKNAEIMFCNKHDSVKLIPTGIYDENFKATYIVEPAFDISKTVITVFNVPLGASGHCIQQYLEENKLKVISHERQSVKNGDTSVYTGVLKFRCSKLDGFENLPTYKIFYNNRKLGIRHSEQYEEKNGIAEENQRLEEKERERKQLQREEEQRNAERNRLDKALR